MVLYYYQDYPATNVRTFKRIVCCQLLTKLEDPDTSQCCKWRVLVVNPWFSKVDKLILSTMSQSRSQMKVIFLKKNVCSCIILVYRKLAKFQENNAPLHFLCNPGVNFQHILQ